MRSIAETGKDVPIAHTAAAALVLVGAVLRHRAAAAACVCLTTAVATYCTPKVAAQIRPADGFLHN